MAAVAVISVVVSVLALVVSWLVFRQSRQQGEEVKRQTAAMVEQGEEVKRQTAAMVEQGEEMKRQTAAMLEQVGVARQQVRAAPAPSLEVGVGNSNFSEFWGSVYNHGAGPGLHCIIAYHGMHPGHVYVASKPVSVDAHGSCPRVELEGSLAEVARAILEDLWTPDSSTDAACVCKDQVGNCYRFIKGRPDYGFYAVDSTEPPQRWVQTLQWPR